jgi:hypothetical protein
VNDAICVRPMPNIAEALEIRITLAIQQVDEDTRSMVWTELDHRLEICHVNDCQ